MKKHWLALPLGAIALASACYTTDSCVAEGTQVSTPLGLRAIESLRVGDEVWAVDPRTGERVATTIVAIKSAVRECLALRLEGAESLVCTPDHPIYVAEAGTFMPAVSFLEGKARQVLRVDERGARAQTVRAVLTGVGLRRVFDITVESEHHDFIADGVLVHNKSDPDLCDPLPVTTSPECIASTSDDTSTPGESTDEASTSADASSDSGTGGSGTGDTGSSEGSGTGDTSSGTGDTGSGSDTTGSDSDSTSSGD
jgi:hypothetical protein